MEVRKDNTEEKIIEAATAVFVKKGMDGARMQEIADQAGINKALLHYYFRSKEKLFDAIFTKLISIAFPRIGEVLYSEMKISDKIEQIVTLYFELLCAHPYLPAFIIREMNREGTPFFKLIEAKGFSFDPILEIIRKAIDNGEIRKIEPGHFIVQFVGMCVYPFAVRPIIAAVALGGDLKKMPAFLEEHKHQVIEFIQKAIQPE